MDPSENAGLTVLVVDDDEASRYSTRRVIQQAGYSTLEAATGEEALELAARGGIDLIVLDVRLPGLSGWEVCQRLKADPATSPIPVVHLSSTYIDAASVAAGLEGGADAYLTQPVDSQVLVATVRALLRARRAEAALRESEARYRSLFEGMTEGFALHEIICDGNDVPVDFRFLEVNPAFERLTGLRREAVEGRTHNEVLPDDDPRWVKAYGEVALTGTPTRFENYSPALQRHYEVFAYRPAPRQFAAVFLDITARVETEERLRQAHVLLNRHVDNSPLATVEWDGEFHIVRWAGEAERVFGWTAEEVLGKRIDELPWVYAEDAPLVEATMADMLSGRSLSSVNANRNLRKDGQVIHCEWYNTAVRDAEGRLVSVLSQVLDVTERERAEQALRESEAEYRHLAESIEDSFTAIDHDLKFTYWNRAVEELSGIPAAEALGKTRAQLFGDSEESRRTMAYQRECVDTGRSLRYEGEATVQGQRRVYDVRLFPTERGASIISRDITERRHAESVLQTTLQRFHTVLSGLYAAILLVTDDGRVEYANQAFVDFFNLSATPGELVDVTSSAVVDRIADAYLRRDREIARIEDLVRGGQPVRGEEIAMRDGRVLLRDFIPIRVNGASYGRLWHHLDITARKQAEEVLRRQASLLDLSQEAILSWQYGGAIVSWNRGAEQLYGYSREEAIGRVSHELLRTVFPGTLEGLLTELAENQAWGGELIHTTKDGRAITVETRQQLIDDGAGSRVVLETNRDITARKQAEEALAKSEHSLVEAQRIARIGDWEWAIGTGTVRWSAGIYAIYGVDPETFTPDIGAFGEFVHPEDRGLMGAVIEQLTMLGNPISFDFRIIRPDGAVRVLNTTAEVTAFDAEGKPLVVAGTNQDVTERKQVEEALRESESRYRELVQRANSAIIRWRRDGTITFFNEYAQEFFGYREEEALGQDVRMLVPAAESDGGDLSALLEGIVAHPEVFARNVNENVLRDGRRVWMAWTNRPIFDAQGEVAEVLAVGTDITERREAEEALRESQAALQQSYAELEQRVAERTAELRAAYGYARRLLEASLDPLVTISPEGKVTDVNVAAEEATGLSREELTGTDFSDYFTEPEQARAGYEQVFRDGSVRDYPLELRHRDGSIRSVLYNAAVYQDGEGRPIGVFAAARDVTERRKAEAELARHREHLEELVQERTSELKMANEQLGLEMAARKRIADAQRESEERLRFALENSHTGAWDLDLVGHSAARSREHDRIFGYDQLLPQWTYEMFLEHVLPEDRPTVDEKFRAAMATGGDWNVECRIRRVDGEVRWIWAAGRHSLDRAGRRRRMAGIVQDITARKQAEQAALEAERARAALAQSLTSEIAHRTKNNLAIVAGLLQLQPARDDAPDLHTDLIRDAVTRIMSFAALHEQMYQRHTGEVELLDALQRIAEVDRQALSAGEIDISVEGEPAEYPASVATNLCVIANELITNAIKHGIGPGGRGQVEVRVTHREGRLVLSVWNAHSPIAADFDVRKGGRTGLSLVRSIMEDQYGGTFTLVPERGGTVACVMLDDAKLLAQ